MITSLPFAMFQLKKHCHHSWRMYLEENVGPFPLSPPPVEAIAAATSVFTEYVFCESVDSAHISQISSTFQEADCLCVYSRVYKRTALKF